MLVCCIVSGMVLYMQIKGCAPSIYRFCTQRGKNSQKLSKDFDLKIENLCEAPKKIKLFKSF